MPQMRIGMGGSLVVTVLLFAVCGSKSTPATLGEILPSTASSPVIATAPEFIAKETKVYHAADAAVPVIESAKELAEKLSKITGREFTIEAGDGSQGIVVGTVKDFPQLAGNLPKEIKDIEDTEQYILRSTENAIHMIGSDGKGVSHAVADFLYRLGYRYYFPGAHWKIFPSLALDDVRFSGEELQKPDYNQRTAGGYYSGEPIQSHKYDDWRRANRVGGTAIHSGHVYDSIRMRNKDVFDAHPEYLALVDGQRSKNEVNDKFCTSNPALVRLVVEDRVKERDAIKTREQREIQEGKRMPEDREWSMSMDPSDGLGWCECEPCAAMFPSVTDHVVYLANAVAEAVAEPDRTWYIGILSYAGHSAPPKKFKPHKNIIVTETNGYRHSGLTIEQGMQGWAEVGMFRFGVYEYVLVPQWNPELPTRSKFSDLPFVGNSIKEFHELGARFYTGESSGAGGTVGLGTYLASRYWWNVKDTERQQEFIDDFLVRCFGKAAEIMREYVKLNDASNRPILSDDWFSRVYEVLGKAYEAENDPAVRTRLDDLTIYIRYGELMFIWQRSQGDAKTKTGVEAMTHAYRQRERLMINWIMLLHFPARDSSMQKTLGYWETPEEWKDERPFEAAEIAGWIDNAATTYKRFEFSPVSYSGNLVPADSLNLGRANPGGIGLHTQTQHEYRVWTDKVEPITFKAKHGIVEGYRSFLPDAVVELLSDKDAIVGTVLDSVEIPKDWTERDYSLQTPFDGLHTLRIVRTGCGSWLLPDDDFRFVREASVEKPFNMVTAGMWYIYVPPDVEVLGGYIRGELTVFDSAGNEMHKHDGADFFAFPIPPSDRGKALKIRVNWGDEFQLMTVPPYLAQSPQQMLVPEELLKGAVRNP